MLDLRAPLILVCAATGAMLGAGAWLAAGRSDVFAPMQERLDAVSSSRATMSAAGDVSAPSGAPLFALSAGPGAVSDPPVTVLGLSRMPGRSAVLLAVAGKPPAWTARGESLGGVIVRDVDGARAVLDLPLGVRSLRVGESAGVSGPSTTAPAGSTSASDDGPPAGFRSPPPPASAPGLGG